MRRLLFVGIALLVVACFGVVAYRMGWVPGTQAGRQAPMTASGQLATAAPSSVPTQGAVQTGAAMPSRASGSGGGEAPAPVFDGNVGSLEWGAKLESAPNAIDGLLSDENEGDAPWESGDAPGPKDIVISFYDGQPALIDAVEIDNGDVGQHPDIAPRDVEVWTSETAPDKGFTKTTAATVQPLDRVVVPFAPVEARFVKLRLLRNQLNSEHFQCRRVKVHEAQAPGYVPLLTRRQDLLGPLAPSAVPAPSTAPAQASGACVVAPETPPPPGHGESRQILVISGEGCTHCASTTGTVPRGSPLPAFPLPLDERNAKERIAAIPDLAIADRIEMTVVKPVRAQLYMLSEQRGVDTVVALLPCTGYPMSAAFKQALIKWVAAGHKLIIQDADKCVPGPDYSWLPFRIQTDTPGARGEPGSALRILEDNWMAQNRPGHEGFIDTSVWEAAEPPINELGDSNVVTAWDANWCGHMVVRNVQHVFGFVHAYAHYGRGLIVYSGLDVDMAGSDGYDHLVARELAQGFAPDNLPCSIHVGSFVIAPDSRYRSRAVEPGRTYDYPLTLLSNMKYQGSVTLSASPIGASGVQAVFDPATVAVRDEQRATMKLTVPAGAARSRFAVEVKGTDTDGKTNSLCLQLGPPTGGELNIVSGLAPAARTGKNLEIILDASGSMKTAMGKKSRWDVALDTLHQVLARLPDDFNVGLRIYGHRESSRSPRTCTDSELVMPIEKIDRQGILDRAKSVAPKGETPLVYSVLQAPADLKAVGGGTVIVITDGEESCKGDPVKAAADLKASGLDIRLNIVGFTLTDPRVQKDLSGFAQSTGGLFYSANSGAALGDALMLATIQSFPYTVYDMAGKVVASGEAGRGSEELPPGDYKVVVKAGSRELVAPRVTVGVGQSITLTIVMKNGEPVLQQGLGA